VCINIYTLTHTHTHTHTTESDERRLPGAASEGDRARPQVPLHLHATRGHALGANAGEEDKVSVGCVCDMCGVWCWVCVVLRMLVCVVCGVWWVWCGIAWCCVCGAYCMVYSYRVFVGVYLHIHKPYQYCTHLLPHHSLHYYTTHPAAYTRG
jgi:hypothetical protein